MGNTSVKNRLVAFFQTGRDITMRQAEDRFGPSVTQRIADLRDEGYPIYTNRKTINGYSVLVYRLGTFPKSAKTAAQRRQVLLQAA